MPPPPLDELAQFDAGLEEVLAPERKRLQEILGNMAGKTLESLGEQQKFVRQLGALMARVNAWFSPDGKNCYRLKVKPQGTGLGEFYFKSGSKNIPVIKAGEAIPSAEQLKLFSDADCEKAEVAV